MIKYIFFLTICLSIPFLIPQVEAANVTIPATYGHDRYMRDTGNNDICDAYTLTTTSADPLSGARAASSSNDCFRSYFEFNLTSIPDGATITGASFIFEVLSITGDPDGCEIYSMEFQPSTRTDTQNWDDTQDGTEYIDNDVTCTTTGTNRSIVLPSQAVEDIKTGLLVDWFALGVTTNDELVDGDDSYFGIATAGTPAPSLSVTYTPADAITTLAADSVRFTQVDLIWDLPNTNGTITGYQINYTTPQHENVATIAINDTASSARAYTVTGLTGSTDYSFRAGYWFANGYGNGSGNVLNITTIVDPTTAFTPKTFNLTDVGEDIRDIRFEEITVSPTSKRLNVTFPNTFTNLKCDLSYTFLAQNRTYENLDSIVVDAEYNETSFLFTDVDNEIITTYCWNDTDGNGTYIITQTSIPLVNQIKLFQAGEFGTDGGFGAIDVISLIAFGIIATLGFNSKNESVGAVFLFALTFGMAWFGIITLPTAMGGIIAVVILLAVIITRKD